jgi:phosphatidylethanolamine-binding protein (PEBP) family uncharacterized protein
MSSENSAAVYKSVGLFLVWASSVFALIALVSNGLSTKKTAAFFTKVAFGSSSGQFSLSSPAFNDGEYLPDDYSCLSDDGVGVSPPLQWSNVPEGTEQFFITMTSQHDESSCQRFEWTLFNIAGTLTSLDADTSEGDVGGSYPGDPKYEYASPCSSGMGDKTYTFKIYALSVKLNDIMKTSDVVGPAIVTTVENGGYVLGTASLTTLFNHGIPPAPLPTISSLRRLTQAQTGTKGSKAFKSTGNGDAVPTALGPMPVASEEEASSDDEYCIKI